MTNTSALVFTIGVLILSTGCDRPSCSNTDPIFDKYPPEAKEYKDELVKQLAATDRSELSYWMDAYIADDSTKTILVYIQSNGLCAKMPLSIHTSEKGIEGLISHKGMGYHGAKLEGLKFDIKQDSTTTAFIFQEISNIVD